MPRQMNHAFRASGTSVLVCAILAILGLRATSVATGQPFDLSWHTVDGGGATFVGGGAFQLGGTIGQPDASSFATPMSGGSFTLVGGFWTAAGGGTCSLPGDMNGDSVIDGDDVQLFINCVLGVNGANCACADFDG